MTDTVTDTEALETLEGMLEAELIVTESDQFEEYEGCKRPAQALALVINILRDRIAKTYKNRHFKE